MKSTNGKNLRKAVMTWACFIGVIPYTTVAYNILSLICSRVVFYAKGLLYALFKLGQCWWQEFTMLQRILCMLNLSYTSNTGKYGEENDRKHDCIKYDANMYLFPFTE